MDESAISSDTKGVTQTAQDSFHDGTRGADSAQSEIQSDHQVSEGDIVLNERISAVYWRSRLEGAGDRPELLLVQQGAHLDRRDCGRCTSWRGP